MVRFLSTLMMIIFSVGLVNAQAKKPETIKLALSGMHCENCVAKVDEALRGVKGVKDVKVDLESGSAEVVLVSASVKPDALIKAVAKAGYKAQVGDVPPESDGEMKESCCTDEAKKEGGCDGKECNKETKKKTSGKS